MLEEQAMLDISVSKLAAFKQKNKNKISNKKIKLKLKT